MPKLLLAGAILGFLGVALGAFGAHALRDQLSQQNMAVFQTATHYQQLHAVGILAIALGLPEGRVAGWLWTSGVVVFSGSLYALSLTDTRAFGAITPVGGLLLLSGWFWLSVVAIRSGKARSEA